MSPPPNPASAAARNGSGNDICFDGEQFPNSAPAQKYQAQNGASEITCAAMRRIDLRARLDGLLEIVAANAEAARLSLRIADDRGGRYHFGEAWDSIQEADRGFAELRALSGSHKEPSR